MENPEQLDRLARILIILFTVFGTFASLIFLYLMGWVVVFAHRLYKNIEKSIRRKKLFDPNETLREVDTLLHEQHTDFIFKELAK